MFLSREIYIKLCQNYTKTAHAFGGSSGHVIRTYQLYYQSYLFKRKRKPEYLRLLWDVIVFQIDCYLVNIGCLKLKLLINYQILCKFWYNFDTVLYQSIAGAADF